MSFSYGAAHGSELQFLYDSFDRVAPPLSPAEHQLASSLVTYWTDFARDADPNAAGVPRWSAFDPSTDDMQALVAPQPAPFFTFVQEHHVLFWTALTTASAGAADTAQAHASLTVGAARAAARSLRPASVRHGALLPL